MMKSLNNEISKELIIYKSREKELKQISRAIFLTTLFIFGFYLFIVKPTENSIRIQWIALPLGILCAFILLFELRKLKDKAPGLI